MSETAQRILPARAISLAGVVLLVFGVALYEGRVAFGPLPLDAVTLTVPLALLASVPFLRARGLELVTDTGIVVPALAFLGFALLSCISDALSVGTFLTFARYLSYLLLTGVIAIIARDAAVRRFIMWAVALAGMATVAYGGWWYLTSLVEVRRAIASAGGEAPAIALRVVSTFQNANFYSEFLVLLIAALGYLVVTEERLPRWVAASMALVSAAMLLLTYTRGSWFGLLGAAVMISLAIAPRRAWSVLAIPVVITLVSPTVQNRLVSLIALDGSAGFRLRLWRVAGAAILAAPLTGSGIGTFYEAFAEAVTRDPALAVGFAFYGAHNSYFTLLAETGVFGGIAFVAVVLAALRVAARPLLDAALPMSVRMQIGAVAIGLGAFALNALTSNSFQHPQPAVFFWLLTGVLIAIVAEVGPSTSEADVSVSDRDHTGVLARLAQASVFARVTSHVGDTLAVWWQASATRAVLVRPPAHDSSLVLSSFAARVVLGDSSR
ncbi:MAG: O-antigen ligase family protein [Coriobacteriia bacterium]|nr:O-antigen ligase family protein [Coriobacteriia bacterium]